jgi:hypothetical protein
METQAEFMARMAKEVRKDRKIEQSRREYADTVPSCSCGWNGDVRPGAHGQCCPNCGDALQ